MNYKLLIMKRLNYRYLVIILLGFFFATNLQSQSATSVQANDTVAVDSDRLELAQTQGLDEKAQVDIIKKHDRWGVVMTITAMGVVFLGLIALYLLFILIGGAAVSLSIKRTMKAFGLTKEEAKDMTAQSGDIYAAIAMAIYEATELHDEENAILTIKNTVRNYSPWSSKIYTLRETPRKVISG